MRPLTMRRASVLGTLGNPIDGAPGSEQAVIGLDTNVLVRFIVQDDPVQSSAATSLMETSCSPDEPGYISLIVLVELAWVLGGAYKYDRSVVASVSR